MSVVETTTLTGNIWEFGFNTDVQKQAQQWQANSTGTISSILFNIAKHSVSSTDTIRISIFSDSGSNTPGSELAYQTMDGNTLLADTEADTTLSLVTPVNVTNGALYWIVFYKPSTPDGVNYYPIYGDTSTTQTYYWAKWGSGTWVPFSSGIGTARFKTTIIGAGGTTAKVVNIGQAVNRASYF